MALIIFATVFVLAIAFFQVIQGVFSAMIMAVLTTLCTCLAFAVYQPLASVLYTTQPAYADAVALVATFIIPLLVLRILADKFIPGNVVLGVWPDRICGGVLGLLTGIMIVGVLTIAVQLLPFGVSVMTYRPFDSTLQRTSALAPFYSDEFVLAAVKSFSAGSLKADRPFSQVYDDLLLDAYCTRNTAGKFGRTGALPNALESVEFYNAPELRLASWEQDVPRNPLLGAKVLDKFLIVRCKIAASAQDPPDKEDPVRRWRLPATHFRLVSTAGGSYYPLAYLTYDTGGWAAQPAPTVKADSLEGEPGRAEIGKLIVVRPSKEKGASLTVDWVYRVPFDAKPRYVVFRRTASKAPADKQDHTDQLNLMPSGITALDRVDKLAPKSYRSRRNRRD